MCKIRFFYRELLLSFADVANNHFLFIRQVMQTGVQFVEPRACDIGSGICLWRVEFDIIIGIS